MLVRLVLSDDSTVMYDPSASVSDLRCLRSRLLWEILLNDATMLVSCSGDMPGCESVPSMTDGGLSAKLGLFHTRVEVPARLLSRSALYSALYQTSVSQMCCRICQRLLR